MAYICFCNDRPGSLTKRRAATAEHLEYIETIMQHILVAGPLTGEDTDDFIASCFVYDTDDARLAERLLHNDPYFKAGIYAHVSFHRFRPAAGAWIGGKTW